MPRRPGQRRDQPALGRGVVVGGQSLAAGRPRQGERTVEVRLARHRCREGDRRGYRGARVEPLARAEGRGEPDLALHEPVPLAVEPVEGGGVDSPEQAAGGIGDAEEGVYLAEAFPLERGYPLRRIGIEVRETEADPAHRGEPEIDRQAVAHGKGHAPGIHRDAEVMIDGGRRHHVLALYLRTDLVRRARR